MNYIFEGDVMHSEDSKMPEMRDEQQLDEKSIEQQLLDAQKEIEDLKSQIMWLERSYE